MMLGQGGFVAHFADGSIFKGFTEDLAPSRPWFHLRLADSGERRMITLADLKAVFRVKSLKGDPEREDRQDGDRPGYGRKIRVLFKDGEQIVGYTNGYAPERPAFFLIPVDPASNNNQILVVNRFVEQVAFV